MTYYVGILGPRHPKDPDYLILIIGGQNLMVLFHNGNFSYINTQDAMAHLKMPRQLWIPYSHTADSSKSYVWSSECKEDPRQYFPVFEPLFALL